MTKSPAPLAPVIFVTGGSRGIGRSIVELATAKGYKVAFTYRSDQDAASSAVAEAEASGGEALAIRADVSSQSDMKAAFEAAMDRFGHIDCVVNNAGVVGEPRPILDVDEALLSHVFSANVFGTFYAVAEAVRHMSTQRGARGGSIVNMSSAAARHGGMVGEAHYASSKGAVDSLTVALAKALPAHGIRINAVRPGVIDTTLHEIHGGEAAVSAIAPSIPLGRAGTVDEVAEVVMFLLEDGSSYMHGALVDITGGR